MSELSKYAKQCPKYQNAYFVKKERDCINCINSDESAWSHCLLPEIKWKQQRFALSKVKDQKTLLEVTK